MSRLEIDPIACRAHGLCAELLPELLELDEWGYPILHRDPDDGDTVDRDPDDGEVGDGEVGDGEVAPGLERVARRAVRACPTLALRLTGSA